MGFIMTVLDLRDRFRPYALDGAVQYFHPRSGTHVRIAGSHTHHVRKTAPRVVMFGITNACNLACPFCSRDERRESRWTEDSAFAALRDLSRAGALEVAFGGGEPFVFPRFPELITRLHAQTPLALNVTTNGTLLDRTTWAPFAGKFGQVRVSIYGDSVWRRCAELFAETGQLWGANILVDNASTATLPATLADLAAAGCHDVSLLAYVGEPARLLSPRARRELAEIALASHVPCRISVCFGSSLEVPRLLAGFDNDGDCGAGSDFITVTPDQRVQSCSFQEHGFSGTSADEILTAWRTQRATLARPSPRIGCARQSRDGSRPAPLPAVAIWQGFSGNNSGECILVAKFQSIENARAYLEELLPGWQAGSGRDEPFSAAWKELFLREQVTGESNPEGFQSQPDELVRVGRSVLATGYGVGDEFPELRALAWKRGARVLPGGIHVHDPITLFGAIAARDDGDRKEIVRAIEAAGMESFIHGLTVFVPVPAAMSLTEQANAVIALAAGRPVAAELCEEWAKEDVVHALSRLGRGGPTRPRLWIRFPSTADGPARTRRFADTLSDQQIVLGSNWLIVDPVLGRKRVAVLAYRRDAEVTALDAETVSVLGQFWRPRPPSQKGKKVVQAPMPTTEELQATLRRQGAAFHDATVESRQNYNDTLSVEIPTAEPGRVLSAMEVVANNLGLTLWPGISDPEPTLAMLARLRADLDQD